VWKKRRQRRRNACVSAWKLLLKRPWGERLAKLVLLVLTFCLAVFLPFKGSQAAEAGSHSEVTTNATNAKDTERLRKKLNSGVVHIGSGKETTKVRADLSSLRESERAEESGLPPLPSYRARLSQDEVLRLKEEAWKYRKWINEPLYKHRGINRFVVLDYDPITVRCAVGYDTFVILPFKVSARTIAVGNPKAFDVQVLADQRTLKISPIAPFQATNILIKADPNESHVDPQNPLSGLVTLYVEEVYDEPRTDYVVWIVRRDQIKLPEEENLIRFALSGDDAVLPPVFRQVAQPVCLSFPDIEGPSETSRRKMKLLRLCRFRVPTYRLYLFEGSARCFGYNCDFEATLEDKTVIGVKGNERAKICSGGVCQNM